MIGTIFSKLSRKMTVPANYGTEYSKKTGVHGDGYVTHIVHSDGHVTHIVHGDGYVTHIVHGDGHVTHIVHGDGYVTHRDSWHQIHTILKHSKFTHHSNRRAQVFNNQSCFVNLH